MRLQADCLSDARFTKIEGNAPAFPERRAVSHVHDRQ